MKKSRKPQTKRKALLNASNIIALIVLSFCGMAAWWFMAGSAIDLSIPETLSMSIQNLGWRGVLAYISFLSVAIVIGPIPSTPVTVAAGTVWGPVLAGIYGTIGIFLGSITAYFIGRTLGRSVAQVLTGKVISFSTHRGELRLGWLIFIAHAIPIMPYELVSYGAGITRLSLPIYASTCFLGIMPGTFLLTYLGSTFSVSLPLALTLVTGFLAVLIILPWGVNRYNWFGLRGLIQID